MTTINHQVKGASVELETLQQLRFLAQGFIRSKQKARLLTGALLHAPKRPILNVFKKKKKNR